MKLSSRVYKYNILNILLLFVCMTLLSAAVNYNSCSSKTVADNTRNMLPGLAAVFVLVIAGAAAYKAMH